MSRPRTKDPEAKRNSAKDLKEFAEGIEAMLRKADKTESVQRIVCRHLTGADVKVSAVLASKWVEWMYGKATEHHEHTGLEGAPMAVEHTIKFGDDKSER